MIDPEPLNWPADWEASLPKVKPRVRDVCRGFHLDDDETEDVFQVVTIKIWSTKDNQYFENLRALRAWAGKVARRIILKKFRPPPRRTRIEYWDPALLPAAVENNTTSSDLAEYLKLVPDALQRETLRLRFCEGLSFREIAKALHLSVGKAYALVVAGLEALVQKLRRTQHDEGERP